MKQVRRDFETKIDKKQRKYEVQRSFGPPCSSYAAEEQDGMRHRPKNLFFRPRTALFQDCTQSEPERFQLDLLTAFCTF
jgi:hypothetical protein